MTAKTFFVRFGESEEIPTNRISRLCPSKGLVGSTEREVDEGHAFEIEYVYDSIFRC